MALRQGSTVWQSSSSFHYPPRQIACANVMANPKGLNKWQGFLWQLKNGWLEHEYWSWFLYTMYFSSKWEPSLIKNGRRFSVDAIFLLSGYFSSKRKGHVHSNFDKVSCLISTLHSVKSCSCCYANCIRDRFLSVRISFQIRGSQIMC